MRFLVDAQLPPALARWLIDAGHQAEHVFDIARADATDSWIWEYARQCDAVIVTKDQDFVAMRTLDPDGPSVVWIRIGNTTKRHLLGQCANVWPAVLAALEDGERLIEVT